MKVSELIKILNKLDGELEVVTEAIIQEDCGYMDVIGTDTILLLAGQSHLVRNDGIHRSIEPL